MCEREANVGAMGIDDAGCAAAATAAAAVVLDLLDG